MKKVPTLTVFLILCIYSASAQKYGKVANPSYRFESVPGFINITELNAAIAVGDSMPTNSRYYFGLTNVFGYQINRNFSGGVGIGLLKYDTRQLIPVYLEYKFNFYIKSGTPYLFTDAGVLQDPVDFLHESKLFINPGIGISRYISSKFELNFSAGLMVQTRTSLKGVGFANFKLGLIFRKNAYRMFKQKSELF